ncbi:MAG: cation diffusion facilitator family transporter [Gammaproteobacteria bacterium]|nr:cation diffusion facilitator family transporter [Gammaproteobacteria bacterium]MBU1646705.1 cation diffusion facilitator family transporter [Gammaproteobacteria bacterium]MBU1971738.1 cation diffusion facilitator family transporter [Gammaproteobacteria bacterium]
MSHGAEDASHGSIRAIFYALGANFGIAVAKYFAAFWTGSGSMLAEAIHSTADCANQLLLLLGLKEAKRPESADHPLGHHRVTYFWSMVVALLLFFMGGAFSVYEGVERLLHPQPLANGGIAMAVLAVAVVLEAFSLAGAMREIRKTAGAMPFLKWFRETRQSELMVVAGEDIAALAGLALALVAVSLSVLTGNPMWDALGTLAVGVVLMVIAVAVMIEVKSLIVGESVGPQQRAAIEAFVAAQPEVEQVLNVITLAWGDKMVIAVKARMTGMERITGIEMIRNINAVEARMQERFPEARWVFFEPDER